KDQELDFRHQPKEILLFSNDIQKFCQQKNIKKFSLMAYSAGGPFGLSAAYSLGKQNDDINGPTISKLAIISSVAPYDAPIRQIKWIGNLNLLAKNSPSLLSIIARLEAKFALSNPVKASCEIQLLGPLADKEVGQVETAFWEYGLWGKVGFKLSNTGKEKDGNIEVRCKVWYGEEDYGCTIAMGKYIADQIEGFGTYIIVSYCI
ncbi:28124_t:CDS:2, partial [Gigaspora margarita]